MNASLVLGPIERPLFTRATAHAATSSAATADIVTVEAFLAQANCLAQRLSASGQSCINLCEDRANFALGFCAVLLAELQNLLPVNQLPNTIGRLVESVEGCFILTDSEISEELDVVLDRLAVARVDIASAFDAQAEDDALAAVAKQGAAKAAQPALEPMLQQSLPRNVVAATVFTSGSTGEPTAISKPWHTLCGTTELLQRRFLPTAQITSVVATVPAQHMYGLEMSIMMALRGSCNVYSGRPFFPADIVQALASMPAPRLLVTTPIHMKTLVRSGLALPALCGVVSATAPLEHALADAAQTTWGCPVREIYGCSEGGSLASRTTVDDDIWSMLDGIHLRNQNETLQVEAPHLEGPVLLQDNLEILSASQFRFIGRGSDMINIGGKRASLMQLNRELLALGGVEDGIFFMRTKPGKEDRLAALVVTPLEAREVMRQLAEVIDSVFLPRPLKKVSAVPRNSVGKSTLDMLQAALGDVVADNASDD